MPHCIVEYSATLTNQIDIDRLLDSVMQTVSDSPLFNPASVSARAQAYTDYRVGTGNKDFIHITIRLFAGRSDDDKQRLTQTVGEAVKGLGAHDTLISCECVDMHTASSFRDMG